MINWLHTNIPDAVLWQIGNIQIHWYGLIILIAIVVAFMVVLKLALRFALDKEKIWDLTFWLVVGGLLSARVYEVLIVDFAYYWHNPLAVFKIWQGGLAIHGAWLGGLIVLYWFSRKYKLNLLKLLDLAALGTIVGQAVGRWGNYFNQELYGLPTDLPWAIPISQINRLPGYETFTHFHPTFLYESLGNLLIFIILLIFLKYKKNDGQIFFVYLGLYSLLRLLTEFIRLDPTLMIFNLRFPAVLSGLLILGAVIGFIKISRPRTH